VDKLRQIRTGYGLTGEVAECRVRESLPAEDPFRLDRMMTDLAQPVAAPGGGAAAPTPKAELVGEPDWTDEIVRRVLERLHPPGR